MSKIEPTSQRTLRSKFSLPQSIHRNEVALGTPAPESPDDIGRLQVLFNFVNFAIANLIQKADINADNQKIMWRLMELRSSNDML
jgi:hypothetical protein